MCEVKYLWNAGSRMDQRQSNTIDLTLNTPTDFAFRPLLNKRDSTQKYEPEEHLADGTTISYSKYFCVGAKTTN